MRTKKLIKHIVLLFCGLTVGNANALELQDFVLAQSRPASIGAMVPSTINDCYYIMTDGNSKILKMSYKTDEAIDTIFNSKTARNCNIENWAGFEMSKDETKILLYTDVTPIYRHSFKANYYVFEIKRNNLKPLSENGKQEIATFSPDGRMVAFVRDNNIILKKLDYGTEVPVTTDGEVNKIINGVPDWVYQEEFGLLNSLSFSPDNLMLSYIQWNESEVPQYSFPLYEGSCNPQKQYALYPGLFEYKYPVAGEKNSSVKVLSYDVETRKTKQMDLPISEDWYIPKIEYSKQSDRLMVMTINRNQNNFKLFAVNPRSTTSKLVYSEDSQSWINIDNIVTMTRFNENSFVIPSEKSGWNHLYEYSNAGNQIRQITKGDWEVTNYYGYDKLKQLHYFQSTKSGSINRMISYVDVKGTITDLSTKEGTFNAQFSSSFNYYVQNFSDAKTPNQYTIWSSKGKMLRELEMNEFYAIKYSEREIPQKEFFQCPSENLMLNGFMIKPLNFNPSKKYPVIMTQYSGPGSQEVKNAWKLEWIQYAALKGYVVVCVDGRGTGYRGKEWESAVYMQLGKYETIDQIAASKYIASLPFVDGNKIGIFGWSYGGYETLMAMSDKNNIFAAGVSIAPVTNWKYYDTVYAERFMRTPQENADGYYKSAPINYVNDIKGELLIISGTADDNVHIANTYEYTAALSSANKLCDMMIYTNMNHSINGCEIRYPLFKKVMKFFDSNLK